MNDERVWLRELLDEDGWLVITVGGRTLYIRGVVVRNPGVRRHIIGRSVYIRRLPVVGIY